MLVLESLSLAEPSLAQSSLEQLYTAQSHLAQLSLVRAGPFHRRKSPLKNSFGESLHNRRLVLLLYLTVKRREA